MPQLALVLATRNTGKGREFRELLAGLPLRIETLIDHPDIPDTPETGLTYLANATAKATAVAQACGLPALADDSGLEVDALGGRPGIHSARFSGGAAKDNVDLLLEELRGVPKEQRTARFRCALVVARPDGRTLTAEGTCEGIVTEAPRGAGGFGYDPVFLDVQSAQTFAELSANRKNQISHRARACAALRPKLMDFLSWTAP